MTALDLKAYLDGWAAAGPEEDNDFWDDVDDADEYYEDEEDEEEL